MEALRATLLICGGILLEPLLDIFRWLVFIAKNAILSRYVLVPFDATQRNQENVVIKIALLDYSHSESRQWGSRALSASSSEPGGGCGESCC